MFWAVVFLEWSGSKWLKFARLSFPNPFNALYAGWNVEDGHWHSLFPTIFVDRRGFIDGGVKTWAQLKPYVIPWPWQV